MAGLFVVANPDVEIDALTVVGLFAPAFHVNVEPLAIVAIKTSPKLSRLQRPGSKVISLDVEAVPHVLAPHVLVPHP